MRSTPAQSLRGQHSRETGKVAAIADEGFRSKSARAETGFGFRQFDRIGVETEQAATGCEPRENCFRVTAIAERAIHRDFSGLRGEDRQNFRNHDRSVRTRGSFSGREDLRDGLAIARGVVLFVFLLEAARILAAVARTPSVSRCLIGRTHQMRTRSFGATNSLSPDFTPKAVYQSSIFRAGPLTRYCRGE